jgi:hypothetical protein
MKHVLTPLTALTLALTGYSLQHAGWFSAHSVTPQVQRQAARQADSDAVYRHRTCQPSHWRAMLMHR